MKEIPTQWQRRHLLLSDLYIRYVLLSCKEVKSRVDSWDCGSSQFVCDSFNLTLNWLLAPSKDDCWGHLGHQAALIIFSPHLWTIINSFTQVSFGRGPACSQEPWYRLGFVQTTELQNAAPCRESQLEKDAIPSSCPHASGGHLAWPAEFGRELTCEAQPTKL